MKKGPAPKPFWSQVHIKEDHANAKLTPDQVTQIRSLTGIVRQVDLAARYNVTQRVISLIQRGVTSTDV